MGVTGLWRLIEPSGKPVPVETLENKVLAVDISIWLHQMVKGYQDARGAPLPNAHLVGLFQRLCKLLYFRIKPVFVFDGGFPELKKETIAKRQDHKTKYNSESQRIKRDLAILLSKKSAISALLGKQISPKKGSSIDNHDQDDIFKLPDLPKTDVIQSESEDDEQDSSSGSIVDIHSIDVNSESFKSLPAKEKYDLLVELKETRKMNSWGKLHELPKKSDNFSDFQMQKLLKRRKVQECLQEVEKEVGEIGMSISELETLLNEGGIDTKIEDLPTRRIASDNTTRFLFLNNIKDTLNENTKQKIKENELHSVNREQPTKKDELDSDLERAIQMSLECVEEPSTSGTNSKTDDSWTSFITDTDSGSDCEGDGFEEPDMTSAKAYIMQYSDFTHKTIEEIVSRKKYKRKGKLSNIDNIIDELNKEKSVIVDQVSLSSDEYDTGDKSDVLLVPKKENIEAEFFSDTSNSLNNDFAKSTKSVDYSEDLVQNTFGIRSCQESYDSLNSDNEATKCPKSSTLDPLNEDIIKISHEGVTESNKNVSVDSDLQISDNDVTRNLSSDSNDDDFEEVQDVEREACKPVVQLTLNMDKTLEDDIFADIFDNTKQKESVPINKTESVNLLNKSVNEGPSKSLNLQEQKDDSTTAIQKVHAANLPKVVTNLKNQDQSENKDSPSSNKSENIIEINDEVLLVSEKEKMEVPFDKLNMLAEEIEDKEENLLQEKGRLDRIGRNITEQMTKEAQELLQIFGIPYIVAPMEAEAQCAFLESVKLTDGTITDDSDIWLFGGSTVYKNFFNQKKHVLQFLSERIEKSFNLSREQLILLALLVGSDYTTGVTGVGPVTALEILASFPFNKRKVVAENSKQTRYLEIVAGLVEFKKWVRTGRRTDNISLKKKLKNVELTEDFPSIRVIQAYLEPNIEKSEEKFTWGEIDITILRDYAKAKFGWSQDKFDEIIKPVLKRLRDRKIQKTVQDYFKTKVNYESLEDQMSKRVKAAVRKMGPEGSLDHDTIAKKITKKRYKKVCSTADGDNDEEGSSETKAGPSKKRKKGNIERAIADHCVKVVSVVEDKSSIEINIPKTDRFQEIIPQREKDKQNILENKLKAIELFRKTKIDRKGKHKKRIILPKEKAELSESSDSD